MKKVVIITRSFPPVNKTAALRPLAWGKYMREFGYDPIIITRDWSNSVDSEYDLYKPSGKRIECVRADTFQVYYVPYDATLLERFTSKIRIKGSWRLIKLFHDRIGNWFLFHPYRSLYKFSLKLLKNESPDLFILTVPPFNMLDLGFRLNRKSNVPWVVDYRDEYSTSDLVNLKAVKRSRFTIWKRKKLGIYNFQDEKELIRSSKFFTTVAPSGVDKIKKLTGKNGYCIPNGFFENEFENIPSYLKPFKIFTITYPGWLYKSQQIEIILSSIKKHNSKFPNKKVRLVILGGISFPLVRDRINCVDPNYSSYVEITERVSRKESIEFQLKSHLLLLCAHKGAKGIPSSKLYEYIALRKPILVCPGDKGIIDETIQEMQNGFICNTVEETVSLINDKWEEFNSSGSIKIPYREDLRINYNRNGQTKKLCKILDEHF